MIIFDFFTKQDSKLKTAEQQATAGIILFIIATFLIVAMNAFAKMASAYHDPVEIVFYRGIVAMVFLLSFVFMTKRKNVFKTDRPLAHLGRAVVGNCGVVLVFWSYAIMPMADVTAILLTSPLMVTILSIPLLKEKVGPYRWIAVFFGFIGALLIVHPLGQGNVVSARVLIPLAAVFFTALVNIFLRELGKSEDPFTTVFYFLCYGIGLSGLYMPIMGSPPNPLAYFALLGTGIAGGLQLILKTQAYRLAQASILSPFSYTSILWATLIGWVFWDELPTLWIICGAVIIIASNLVIYARERSKRH